MGDIVFDVICWFIGRLALWFMIIPAAMIGIAYLIGILILSIEEMWKD